MVGERLNDRYLVESVVWSGTMSNVFRATDEHHHRTVAVKALLHVFADNILYRSRYEREAQILQQVRHHHIVPYIDHFQEGANFYLVMEYMGGGNLYDHLLQNGALSISQSRDIMLGITDALHTLHLNHIIHRDLKPENVLLNMQGQPFLCDFGEAYTINGQTPSNESALNAVAGTAYYVAPETWDGQPQNAQSDIWALGVMLFEMLTGEVPFKGTSVEEVKQKVQTMPLPEIRRLRPEVSDGLAQILSKSLDKNTATRYTNARSLHQDLKRGHPSSPLSVKPAYLIAAVVGLMLILALIAILILSSNNDDSPNDSNLQPTTSLFGG